MKKFWNDAEAVALAAIVVSFVALLLNVAGLAIRFWVYVKFGR